MIFYKRLVIVLIGLGLLACSDKSNQKDEVVLGVGSQPVPAVPLKSLYADELNCPTLPNPPQQYMATYSGEISPPVATPLYFRACLNFEMGTDELTPKSEEVWQDFRCRIGYAQDETYGNALYEVTVQNHSIINSEIVFEKFGKFKQNSDRSIYVTVNDKEKSPCDIVVDITPRLSNDSLNEQWHICYPMAKTWDLECSEQYGCNCLAKFNDDKAVQNIPRLSMSYY